jgi:phosphohistidine phosphatase
MALTLYLLRHAKAVVADGRTQDFDRPLAERGHREAVELAGLMVDRAYAPARALCSSAQRTRETLGPLLSAWPANASIEISRDLYNADADDLLALVRDQDDHARSLMLIGHNPGIEQLARALAGSGDLAALRRLHDHYPPAGFAVVDFELSLWDDVRPGAGRLSAFETPCGAD